MAIEKCILAGICFVLASAGASGGKARTGRYDLTRPGKEPAGAVRCARPDAEVHGARR